MIRAALVAVTLSVFASSSFAGPIFLTGHDPDFHTQLGDGQNLLQVGLDFATGNTTSDASNKFLWVESNLSVPGGHLFGRNALTGPLGLTLGTHFDHVDAAGLAGVDFSDFTAIAIASSFGGMLSRAELDGLIARSADIETFVNAGGGVFASSECFPCGASLLGGATAPDLFGYLPVDVTSIGASPPFTVTAFGAGLGLSDGDVNDPTHNSFGLVGGLNVVDTDAAGNATTLAGLVDISGGGFIPPGSTTPAPEPGTLGILGLGLVVLALGARRKNATS